MKGRKIYIVDTTLRDGEETAGVVFANREKMRIARYLDELGVDEIEAGIPAMGGDEAEAVRTICRAGLKASIMGWNRPVIKDIEASLACGVDAVAVSVSTSDIHIEHKLGTCRERVVEDMVAAVSYARQEGLYVSVSAEDASRSDPAFLGEVARAAQAAGAARLRYCDTVGILDPFTTRENIQALLQEVAMDIEMHTHNDFGMACANALAGVLAGAGYVGVTVTGLGEGAGNAALEEVVMALKYLQGSDVGIRTGLFREVAEYVSLAAHRELPAWKAVVGSALFGQEPAGSGEAFYPEDVGLQRQIVIGKHAGVGALRAKFAEFGLPLSQHQAEVLLPRVRSHAVDLKRSLFDKELVYVYRDYFGSGH